MIVITLIVVIIFVVFPVTILVNTVVIPCALTHRMFA
jgi:hypothetical protein